MLILLNQIGIFEEEDWGLEDKTVYRVFRLNPDKLNNLIEKAENLVNALKKYKRNMRERPIIFGENTF